MKEIFDDMYMYAIVGCLSVLVVIRFILVFLAAITFVCLAFTGILLPLVAIFATEIMSTPLWILLPSSIPCTICAIGMLVKHGGQL